MPPAPKSPQPILPAGSPPTKRPGAPKAKGAVRAKSGCYTCRIRRKKCDEQPNEHGHCSTCVRLRLECLGFGAKRPEWLRENQNVVLLRDKIKNFLASQGMIKGHSGSGARSSEQPAILRLSLESDSTPYHSSSSSSPPSPPPRSLPTNDYPSRRAPWSSGYDHRSYPRGSATTSEHRSPSPQSNEGYSPLLSPSTVQFSRRGVQCPRAQRYQPYPLVQRPPPIQSTFGNCYNWSDQLLTSWLPPEGPNDPPPYTFVDGFGGGDEFMSPANAAGTQSFPQAVDGIFQPNDLHPLLSCYKSEVVTVQYLLSTAYIRDHIVSTILDGQHIVSDPTSEQRAAALLSHVFYLRFARPRTELVLQVPDVRLQLHEIEGALDKNTSLNSSEDAMAALHLISVVLFDGGSGSWKRYLEIASGFVRARMRGLRHNVDGLEELRKLPEKDAFIVKTAIWFDVLASVTTGTKPMLMDIIKLLFKPRRSRVEELDDIGVSGLGEEKESMMSPMGCENKVVWALAEINALAAWKKEQKERGRLSVKELVQRSDEIERELEVKHHHTVKILSDFNDPVVYSRYIASNIFRASAMLFLHSVVSGGHPHVIQIRLAVEEVMRWIRRIPRRPTTEADKKIHKSVIRSTVFGFYIAGALTDDVRHRKLILEYLLDEAGEHVGNVYNIAIILDRIWEERPAAAAAASGGGKSKVPWRKMLAYGREPVLLV